jgi:hypothetical protein
MALWALDHWLDDNGSRSDLCDIYRACVDGHVDFSRFSTRELGRSVAREIKSGRLLVMPKQTAVPQASSSKRAHPTSPEPAPPKPALAPAPAPPKLPPPPPGVATKAQADALFKELAARKDIPFDYPVDCCYTRAHVMSRQAESKGLTTQKLWYFDKDWGTQGMNASLRPRKPDGSSVVFPDETGTQRPVQWVYHVAPLIKVQQGDGSIQERVLDPSVSDRPLSKVEWKAIQGTPAGAYEEITDSSAYFSNNKHGIRQEDPDLSISRDQLARHRIDRDAALAAAAGRN